MLFNLKEELSEAQQLELGRGLNLGVRLRAARLKIQSAAESKSVTILGNETRLALEVAALAGEHLFLPLAVGKMEAVKTSPVTRMLEILRDEAAAVEINWVNVDRLKKELEDALGKAELAIATAAPDQIIVPAASPPQEDEAEPEPEPEPDPEPEIVAVATEFAESAGGVAFLEELAPETSEPLRMSIKMIEPGWGNTRDNNYYAADMLKREANKFVSAKMYETDHKESETSTRTWVSTIMGLQGFSESGAPIMEVLVHNDDFAARLRNLKAGGILDKMECSIRAQGRVRPGKMGERSGNIVEEITDVASVDWVTKAGAGGQAMDMLSESATDTVPVEIVYLDEGTTTKLVEASGLPSISRRRLEESKYLDQQAVVDAIQAERAYVKELTGSGRVEGMGDTGQTPTVSMEEVERKKDAVNKKWLH